MKAAIEFTAEARAQAGKGSARALRREGKVPAILYSDGKPGVSFALNEKELTLAYKKGSFRNKLVDISIGSKQYHALPREIQLHPVTDAIEHADFLLVTKDSTIRVDVPVHFLNTEKSVGMKRGGVLNIVRHDLSLICKPDAIPAAIEIDLLNVDIGHAVHINDITLPAGVTPSIKRNFTIATIAGRGEEKEEAPVVAAAAPAADGKAAPAAAAKAAPAKDAKKK